jgi:signal transduction histidine kinase
MDAQESRLFAAILIAIIIIAIVVAYFIISVVVHHKKVLMLERKNANAVINALENDRSRIANDLHDDLAPMLSAIKMKINSFELIEPDDQVQLEKTNNNIDEIAKRMRAISFDLMPGSLKAKGLIIAVHEFVNYISKKEDLSIQLNISEEQVLLEEQKVIHVYRIVQEIIQNTLKHAKATQLIIELRKENNMLIVMSKDDGVGFNYNAELKESFGFGLRSLLNRTTLLDGNLDIQSKIGFGTTYIIEIPLKVE